MKKWRLYEWSVITFFFILPSFSILVEVAISSNFVWNIALKWFVFYVIGLRLGTAGIMQIAKPQFTAKTIFDLKDDKAYTVVRELGFANLCFAVIAIVSLFVSSFRLPAAVCGGLYFGMAGLTHVLKSKDSKREVFAMITDVFAFVIMCLVLLCCRLTLS